jgi:hypothetical protein
MKAEVAEKRQHRDPNPYARVRKHVGAYVPPGAATVLDAVALS